MIASCEPISRPAPSPSSSPTSRDRRGCCTSSARRRMRMRSPSTAASSARRARQRAASRSTPRGTPSSIAFPTAPGAIAAAAGGHGRARLGPDPGCASACTRVRRSSPTRATSGATCTSGARVAACGPRRPGRCSRQSTRELVDGELGTELGEHRLKDFDEPVALFQLGDAALPAAEDDLEHEPAAPGLLLRRQGPRARRAARSDPERLAPRHALRSGRLGQDAARDRGRLRARARRSRPGSSGSALPPSATPRS